ncbi:hypothetical protein [Planktothrix agardhii]|uniref:hypothetical protein n=1 Tax=Planktothrix agardhii TaxID=1160 RepID=UPI0020B447D9|nr:hypothetical protein [Planktothrix agardhii]CAD5937204.1 hypothetical protein PCC7811_01688 [Planktothrix agardhii]
MSIPIIAILVSPIKLIITSNFLQPADAQNQQQRGIITSSLPEYCAPDKYKAFFENFVGVKITKKKKPV